MPSRRNREDDTYMKFSCPSTPKHRECNGLWTTFKNSSREGGYEWKVRWAACQQDEAIKFMKQQHGHTYDPDSPNENGPRPKKKYSKKKYPNMHRFFFSDQIPSKKHRPAKAASGKHHTRAPAADCHQNQYHQAQRPRRPPVDGAVLLNAFQRDSTANQGNNQRVEAWMAEHEVPETAIPSDQSRVPGDGMAPNPGMAFDQDMAPPQSIAGAQNLAAAPMIPLPQEAALGRQQQRDRHRGSSHRSKSDHSGQHHRRHRDRVGQEPNPEQVPQSSTMMSPDAWASPVGPPAVPSVPVMYPPQDPSDGQRHRRRRHKSTREPESGLEQYPQPGTSMPVGMVSPTGVPVPPVMPPAQGVMGRQQHQRQRRGPSGDSSHQQSPLSPLDMPPPLTMRECMAVLAEEAVSTPAEEPQDGGMVTDPRMSSMPPPMNPMMSAPPTRNMPMRQGPQPGPGMSPAPPAAGMYAPPSTQLPPTGAPQAGGITTAAGPSRPPSQNLPLRQPRPQPTNPGMLLRAAGAAGTPGAQAMALRPAPGALSATPGMPANLSMQPPPTSMPPFPGTGPGTPASLDLARAPPPPAPTPPFPPGALD